MTRLRPSTNLGSFVTGGRAQLCVAGGRGTARPGLGDLEGLSGLIPAPTIPRFERGWRPYAVSRAGSPMLFVHTSA